MMMRVSHAVCRNSFLTQNLIRCRRSYRLIQSYLAYIHSRRVSTLNDFCRCCVQL